MKALAFTQMNTQPETSRQPISRQLLAKMQVAGAVAGLAGGVGSGLVGALLIVAGWLTVNKDVQHWLSTTGSVLLVLTIPLIILGACCLDWIEKKEPKRVSKIARYDDDDDQ